jgi:hypothetical protein
MVGTNGCIRGASDKGKPAAKEKTTNIVKGKWTGYLREDTEVQRKWCMRPRRG